MSKELSHKGMLRDDALLYQSFNRRQLDGPGLTTTEAAKHAELREMAHRGLFDQTASETYVQSAYRRYKEEKAAQQRPPVWIPGQYKV
jgi:hypothetical protein